MTLTARRPATRPATPEQLRFLNLLRVERALPAIDRAAWDARVASGMTTRDASRQIDQTKALPRVARPVATNAPAAAPAGRVTRPGAFRLDGEVFVVVPTKDTRRSPNPRLYAKRVVNLRAAQGDRLNADGAHVRIEYEYAPGVISRLTEAHRMTVEEGRALTLRFRHCLVCNHALRVAESVERGIGPVCITYFA